MKKIGMVLDHLKISNGVSQVAVGIANAIAENKEDVEVTLIPLYICEKEMLEKINSKVKVKPVFNRYFRGMNKLVDMIPDERLYKKAIKEDYDIEVGFCYSMPTKIISASTNKKAKKFVWVHTYVEFTEYYKKYDKILSVAKGNVEKLREDVENNVEVDYCLNPIDDRKIVKQSFEQIDIAVPEEPLFVSVGRHSPEKGYDRLIDSVKALKDLGYKFKVWLIGDGPIHEELKARAKELNVLDYIEFLGRKVNPHAYTSKAKMFLCPSRREGYSTVCTESLILGVPILTTAVSGAQEMIKDAEAGLLVDNSGKSFCNGLKWILDHPEMIDVWTKKLEETKVKFSYEERKKKLFEIFNI